MGVAAEMVDGADMAETESMSGSASYMRSAMLARILMSVS